MGDAAFADNLVGTAFQAVGGYLDAPNAFHPWSEADWDTVPGPKLPIYVGGTNAVGDADSCVQQLRALQIPAGKYVALDMETRSGSRDGQYAAGFGAVVQHNGYGVLVYGSASTVFNLPQLNGYWVADYLFVPFMYSHSGVRATQWTDGAKYDQSTVKPWILADFWTQP